jgi:hypothetical protein
MAAAGEVVIGVVSCRPKRALRFGFMQSSSGPRFVPRFVPHLACSPLARAKARRRETKAAF